MELTRKTAEEYAERLMTLLPPGDAWRRDPETVTAQVVRGLAPMLARIDDAATSVLEQLDPREAVELLAEWERLLGLPDPCMPADATLAARQAAAHGRLTATGGASRAYFIGLAAAAGYAVTIEEFKPFRAGRGRAGERAFGVQWAHAWRVRAPETTISHFRAGRSTAGERLRRWGDELLECVVGRWRPAHTVLIIAYGDA